MKTSHFRPDALLLSFVIACFTSTSAEEAKLQIRSIDPPSPATLTAGQKLTISIDYLNPAREAVQIWARPYTNGKSTPGYGAHGSQVYIQASGTVEGWFTFGGSATVDEVRVEMKADGGKKLLASASLPIKADWAGGVAPAANIAPTGAVKPNASAPKPTIAATAAEKSDAAASLPWEKDYPSALAKAKDEKRPVFLMLTATWCGPCKMLESQTLPDPLIRSGLKEFVWVKAYEDKALNAKYGCNGYPTLVFLDAQKEQALAKTVGFQLPGPFLKPIIAARKGAHLPLTPEMEKAAATSFEPDRRKLDALIEAGDLAAVVAYLQPAAQDDLRNINFLALKVQLPDGLAASDVVCLAAGHDVILKKSGLTVVAINKTGRASELRIVAPGYRVITERLPLGEAVQSREYQLAPLSAKDAATFSGRVLLPTGQPAAQAIVRICDWGTVVRTDDDGRFRLPNVSPGKFLVRAERPGGEYQAELEFAPGQELQQELKLQPATTVGLRWALQTKEGVPALLGQGVQTGEAYFSIGHSRFLLERGAQTRESWGSDFMLKESSASLRENARPEVLLALKKAPAGTPIFWLFDGTGHRTGLHRETARFEDIASVNGGKPFDEKTYFEFLRGEPVTVGAVYTLRCVRRDCYAKLEVTDVTLAGAKP